MTASLSQYAFACVNENYGGIGVGSSSGHVACVLFVTRGVGHNERSARRREKAVCHIYRNALLSFGFESIDEKSEIQIIARRSVLTAVALQGDELVLHDELGVVQQASNQRGLAVVD